MKQQCEKHSKIPVNDASVVVLPVGAVVVDVVVVVVAVVLGSA